MSARIAALRLSLVVALVGLSANQLTCAVLEGVLRRADQAVLSLPPEQRPPYPNATVTLCSTERAYRVQADGQGRFAFQNIQEGMYDLVAGTRGTNPFTLHGVSVSAKPAEALVVNMPLGPGSSPCLIDSEELPVPYSYDVAYKAPNSTQGSPVINGDTGRWLKDRRGVGYIGTLPKARLSVFRAGETDPVASTMSDNKGQFTFQLTAPGNYELLMTRQGYQDVRVGPFLAPRENVTDVSVATNKVGVVVVSQ